MKRNDALFAAIALALAAAIVFGVVGGPSFTDAYYHFNAAVRLASGQGMTDPYIWTYIGAPDALPAPSHLYWLPMTSALTGVSMALFGTVDYRAAQVPLVFCLWGVGLIGYGLGRKFGGTARHAWCAGLVTLLSPFFVRFWGSTDTFAPYALFGAACLLLIGRAVERPTLWRWALAGAFAALGHLTRADGLLLLGVAGLFALLCRVSVGKRVLFGTAVTVGYALVMSPFFLRNIDAIGAPLPLGGTQAIWFGEYNDLFAYPPQSSPDTLFADGPGLFLSGRREALVNNLGTLIAVEGLVVLLPVMLIAGWVRRRDRFLRPFWLYALLLHIAMTLIFPFPGYRGGLFHSVAALVPFWSALAFAGIDDAVNWVARRRRRWRAGQARLFFGTAALVLIGGLAFYYARAGSVPPVTESPALYRAAAEAIPDGARVLFDDPPALYYFTRLAGGAGLGGATLPANGIDAMLNAARHYNIDYLLLKTDPAAVPGWALSVLADPDDFLQRLPINSEEVRLYAILSDAR